MAVKKVSLLKVNADVILVAEEDDGTLIELPARQAVLSSRDLSLLPQIVDQEIARINEEIAAQNAPTAQVPVEVETPVQASTN